MPTTSSGETVYADPDEVVSRVQTSPESLGLSETADDDGNGASDWQEFLEGIQTKARGRIDDYCRRDFEDHLDDTVVLDGADGTSVLMLPSPVREVHAVRVDGDLVDRDTYHAKLSGALVYTAGGRSAGPYGNRDGGYTRPRTQQKGRWPPGYGNIEVGLDHGHKSAPAAVREAEIKLVENTVVGAAQKREGMVVQADSFELQVNIPKAWDSEIRGMLKPHRRTEVFN